MKFKVVKDERYSKLMRDVADHELVDENMEVDMKLPPWFDPVKNEKGQHFAFKNIYSYLSASMTALLMIASVPSILRVLRSKKKSSTMASAYRRFKMNGFHAQIWGSGPYHEDTRAWKSFEMVRKVHISINKRAKMLGTDQYVTQLGMACTLFLNIGPQVLPSYSIVSSATAEELENYNHHVRAIGYMLGIKDEFNLCGETFEETLGRIEAFKEDFIKPNMMNPTPEYMDYVKNAVDGMWHSNPTLHFDSMMFLLKRQLGIPGYHYFEHEKKMKDESSSQKKILEQLSLYTRFRIFIDILIHEYLTKITIVKYLMIIVPMSFALLEVFPILLIYSFGWKFAMAEKRKKKFL